jgi:hypothetical protein
MSIVWDILGGGFGDMWATVCEGVDDFERKFNAKYHL